MNSTDRKNLGNHLLICLSVLIGSALMVGADMQIRGSQIKTGTITSTQLSTTGVTAATYGTATQVGQFIVDAAGRITAATNVIITHNLLSSAHTDTTAASPSKGDLISSDGSTWKKLAVSTDGYVLTADSTETTGLKWAASAGGGSGGGGALVLLESHTASASASLDFTTRNITGQSGASIQSDYDDYVIDVVGLVPATDNTTLTLLASTNGGSSYDSGTNYATALRLDSQGSNSVSGGNSAQSAWLSLANVDTTTTQASVSLSVWMPHPGSAALYKTIQARGTYKNNDTNYYAITGSGIYLSATAVNAFQFIMSSGNITSGTVRLYGVAKTGSAASTPGKVQIQQIVTASSQATVDFTSIPATYSAIEVEFFSRDTQGGTSSVVGRVKVNNDGTAANYTAASFTGLQNGVGLNSTNAASTKGVFFMGNPQDGNTAGIFSSGVLRIVGYASTTTHKRIVIHGAYDDGTANYTILSLSARWKSTTAVNQITFLTDGTAFKDGSIFTLYGIK